MAVDPGVSREADYQQVDTILLNEIANYLDRMSGHDDGLEVHRMQRRARAAAVGKLREVAVRAIFLFAKLVDHLGVPWHLLFHANHAKARAKARREVNGEIKRLARAIGAVVCNQNLLDHL